MKKARFKNPETKSADKYTEVVDSNTLFNLTIQGTEVLMSTEKIRQIFENPGKSFPVVINKTGKTAYVASSPERPSEFHFVEPKISSHEKRIRNMGLRGAELFKVLVLATKDYVEKEKMTDFETNVALQTISELFKKVIEDFCLEHSTQPRNRLKHKNPWGEFVEKLFDKPGGVS